MATEESPKKRYKLAPPDGGYGYAIVVAASTNLIVSTMFYVSFGMIFHDFFIKLEMGSTGVSVLTGIKAVFIALSGFLTGPLEKIMSKRKLAFLGCVLFNAGGLGLVFVRSKIPFIICQGMLQSLGSGFLINVTYSIVNDYFVKKRMLFMAFIHTLSCGASIVAPILFAYCLAEYGYQGTLIIMSAIGVHSFAACALIQPVAWHMRRVRTKGDIPEKKLLMQTETDVYTMDNTSAQISDQKKANEYAEKGLNRIHRESIAAPGVGIGVVDSDVMTRYIDWHLFRRFVKTSHALGVPTTVFADITYLYFLPRAMYAIGWDKHQVKWAFALLGFGDITSRATLTLLSEILKKIRSHWLFFIGLLLSITTKLALLWVTDYTCALAIISVMGISRSMVTVLMPLVIGDFSGPEKFPSAIGLCFMMFGLISIVLGPIIGAIADAAQSHSIMFEMLIGLLTIIAIAWFFEMWWDSRRTSTADNTSNTTTATAPLTR